MGACSCKEETVVEALEDIGLGASSAASLLDGTTCGPAGGALVTVDVSGNKPFAKTAVIMIGYQHDYFGTAGKLHQVIEASSSHVLANTLKIIEALKETSVLLIETPIIFTEDYRELVEPSGILKAIKDVQAFRSGDTGAETIPELLAYGDRILRVAGKRGLNAFTGTCLERLLKSEGITDVVLCGAVTSVCIDSTGRAAHERGFRVHQLSDCTCGRTDAEQTYYCKDIFPLYANVTTTAAVLESLAEAEVGRRYSAPASVTALLQSNLTPAQVAGCRPFERTAVILIGYQRDYFGADGKLHEVIESSRKGVLANTLKLLEAVKGTNTLLIQTPIIFTPDYSELVEPSGILKVIKDVQAFRAGDPGSETIPEIKAYGERILYVPGKRGLNAFTGTCLDGLLRMEKVTDVVLCGAVTSVCIDSTGRAAHERGYRVHQISDCTCGRTEAEQRHYCQEIFPLYADVTTTEATIAALTKERAPPQDAPVCLQERLDELNGEASVALDLADCGMTDEFTYHEFDKLCSVHMVVEWMRRHPQEACRVRERQEEISVQIQHKLIDLAAQMRKSYEDMERQVTNGSMTPDVTGMDEDPRAPLVTFLSHGKDEAGSMCRLLKLMLKRILRVTYSGDEESELEMQPLQHSAPRVFLDSDNIYSQSELRRSVEQCKVLTLVLTKSTFFRPWIMCEFITAWRNSVPIVLVEVMGSGFDVTPENVGAMVGQCVDDSSIVLVGQYCPNTSRKVLLDCCRSLLMMPRVVIDPTGATSALWASAFDLAKAIRQQADMGSDHSLNYFTMDPVRDFAPPEDPDEDYLAFISYHHSAESVVVARILKLMIESQMPVTHPDALSSKIFLDADSLFDLSSLVAHIERCTNLIILLTNDLLQRPWVIIELVHAVRNGVSLLPVPITKDFDFRPYISNTSEYKDIASQFDDQAKSLFKKEGIRMPEIARALKQMFNVIAQPFYGHCSETVQRAQIFEITRRLSVQQGQGPVMHKTSSNRSGYCRKTNLLPLPGLIHLSANM